MHQIPLNPLTLNPQFGNLMQTPLEVTVAWDLPGSPDCFLYAVIQQLWVHTQWHPTSYRSFWWHLKQQSETDNAREHSDRLFAEAVHTEALHSALLSVTKPSTDSEIHKEKSLTACLRAVGPTSAWTPRHISSGSRSGQLSSSTFVKPEKDLRVFGQGFGLLD